MQTNLEQIFTFLDQEAAAISEKESITYLEGVLFAVELWLDGTRQPHIDNVSKEDIRKGIQLAVLKGMKEQSQPHHQMTPDSLGLLVGYFVEQLIGEHEEVSIMDPAVGTGNLLFTVMNYINKKTYASAVEIDDTLIRLAAATGELLEQPVSLYRQDALQSLLIDPVDVVVSDLPFGYYPDDTTATTYDLKATEGMSYAHHLFIEQSIRHTKDGGYLIFLLPETIFESPLAQDLQKFINKHTWIQAIVQLPDNMFKNKAHAKSMMILQKQSATKKQPREVLLAKVPTMSNKEAMSLFFQKVQIWHQENNK